MKAFIAVKSNLDKPFLDDHYVVAAETMHDAISLVVDRYGRLGFNWAVQEVDLTKPGAYFVATIVEGM